MTSQNGVLDFFDGKILIKGDTGALFSTDDVRLSTDDARIYLRGNLQLGEATLRLVGICENGDRRVLKGIPLSKGEVELDHHFDPVSYSVYSGAVRFLAEICAEGDAFCMSISGLALEEYSQERRSEHDASVDMTKRFSVPRRTLFIGNSLVFGMGGFGMCSTAPDKDYFHHVSSYIRGLDPNAEFVKLHGSEYEHSESMEAFEKWYGKKNDLCIGSPSELFAPGLDLIFLQMGDNINTDEKFLTFKQSGDVLIRRIKEKCPRARLIWIHGWYSRPHVYDEIVALCERHKIERLDIRAARSYESEEHEAKEYLSLDGSLLPIKDTWRTHPGDLGMRKIADMIIDFLRIEL